MIDNKQMLLLKEKRNYFLKIVPVGLHERVTETGEKTSFGEDSDIDFQKVWN